MIPPRVALGSPPVRSGNGSFSSACDYCQRESNLMGLSYTSTSSGAGVPIRLRSSSVIAMLIITICRETVAGNMGVRKQVGYRCGVQSLGLKSELDEQQHLHDRSGLHRSSWLSDSHQNGSNQPITRRCSELVPKDRAGISK